MYGKNVRKECTERMYETTKKDECKFSPVEVPCGQRYCPRPEPWTFSFWCGVSPKTTRRDRHEGFARRAASDASSSSGGFYCTCCCRGFRWRERRWRKWWRKRKHRPIVHQSLPRNSAGARSFFVSFFRVGLPPHSLHRSHWRFVLIVLFAQGHGDDCRCRCFDSHED